MCLSGQLEKEAEMPKFNFRLRGTVILICFCPKGALKSVHPQGRMLLARASLYADMYIM